MGIRRLTSSLPAAIALLAAWATSALAHHATGGRTPGTFFEGLLSGLAHPPIDPAHLAAVLLAGAIAARVGRPSWVAVFVSGSFLGTAVLGLEFPLPLGETLVSVSPLLLAALLLIRSPAVDLAGALVLFAVGVVHGMAFAESIVGAEAMPIAAYLLGLAMAELALAGMVVVVSPWLSRVQKPRTDG